MTRDEVLAMEAEIRSGKRAVYRGHRVHFYPPPIPIRLDWHYDCERWERTHSETTLAGVLDEIDEHAEECAG